MSSAHHMRNAPTDWLTSRSRWLAISVVVLIFAFLPASAPAQTLPTGTTITVTTIADEITANNQCSLREAIQAANLNQATDACPAGSDGLDEIILPAGTYTLSRTSTNPDSGESDNGVGDFDVKSSMRITGAGAEQTIIDGAGIDRVFKIINSSNDPASVQVTISGVTIRNGATPVPTLWDLLAGASPARYSGGAIVNSWARLTIIDSLITGNHAQLNGSAILSVNSLELINTRVTGNLARLDVTDSLLLLFLLDSISLPSVRGGAIVSQDQLVITGSAIDDNVGGGVFNVNGESTVDTPVSATISNSTINRNSRSEFAGAGIINFGGTLMLEQSEVRENTAPGGGAGILAVSDSGTDGFGTYSYSSDVTITDSTIADNETAASGGGIVVNSGLDPEGTASNTLTIRNSTISGNQAGLDGGGIVISYTEAILLLEDSTVSGNSALAGKINDQQSSGYGGIANIGIATIRNSTINGNSATTLYGHGGGIGNDGTMTIIGGAVRENQATFAGGIYNSPNGTLTTTNVTFERNSAQFTGGGIRNDGTLTISGGTIGANTVTGDPTTPAFVDDRARGGGILNLGTLTINEGTQIRGNAAYFGGGIANSACTLAATDSETGEALPFAGLSLPGQASLTNITLSENIATLWGGAIANEGMLRLNEVTLSANETFSERNLESVDAQGQTIIINAEKAGLGAAMVNGIEHRLVGRAMSKQCETGAALSGITVTIEHSTISQNAAALGAGGVANYTTLTISDTEVLGNTAGEFAGGLFNAGTMRMSAGLIADNRAETGFAGGLHNSASLTISSSTIRNNIAGASSDGGGISSGEAGTDLPAYVDLGQNKPPARLELLDSTILPEPVAMAAASQVVKPAPICLPMSIWARTSRRPDWNCSTRRSAQIRPAAMAAVCSCWAMAAAQPCSAARSARTRPARVAAASTSMPS
jgi:CSLREA domain-containing protein